MSNWRDQLRRVVLPDGRKLIGASFRRVPFLVATAERSGGRRVVVHEFPLRDVPHVEDLGRATGTFTVDAYVIGDDYVEQRDRLLSALEDVADPGQLVHPYYGSRRAICTAFTVRESIAEGGMAVVSINFTNAPDQNTIPIQAVDFVAKTKAAAATAQQASRSELESFYQTLGQPGFALVSAEQTLRGLSAGLKAAAGPVLKTSQELALMAQQTDLLVAEAASLIRLPGTILDRFIDSIAILADSIAAPFEKVAALFRTYDVQPVAEPDPTTPIRQRELDNLRALSASLRIALLCQAAGLACEVDYESTDQAIQAREQITDRLDDQIDTAPDAVFPALLELRAAVVTAIPGDAVHARVLTIERRVDVSSIALAYRLYGSVDQELDLVARNNAPRPAFMSGTLQVLSDV